MNFLKSFALILLVSLLLTGCNKPKGSREDNLVIQPELPGTSTSSQEDLSDPSSEEDDKDKVYEIETLSENPKAKELSLEAALLVDLPSHNGFLDKLDRRGLRSPANQPEAEPLLHFAYLAANKAEEPKAYSSGKNPSGQEVFLVPLADCKEMLKNAFQLPALADQLTNALIDSTVYDKGAGAMMIPKSISPKSPLKAFTMEVSDSGDQRTVILTPAVDGRNTTSYTSYTYQYQKGTDSRYRLVSSSRVGEETVTLHDVTKSTNITEKLNTDPNYQLTIVGSVGDTPIAIDYWDQVLTVYALDAQFNKVKEVTFEAGMPKISFRDSRIFLRFPKQVVVLNASLEALFMEPLPTFMLGYVQKYPNPTYEKNLTKELELYDYDLSGDYKTYLYASGLGMFLYSPSSDLQRTLVGSEVKVSSTDGQFLYTPFRVRFNEDSSLAYGYFGAAGDFLRADIGSRIQVVQTSAETATDAIIAYHSQMGDFFNPSVPGLAFLGKDYYLSGDLSRSLGSQTLSLGKISDPASKFTYPSFGVDSYFSALLDDGRIVFTYTGGDKTETFCSDLPVF